MAKKNAIVNSAPAEKVRQRNRRSFWSRALQAPKVQEALTTLGVKHGDFEKAYNATRKTRETATLTPENIKAIQAFFVSRDIEALAKALDCSVLTANVKVTKAIMDGSVKVG